MTTELTPMEREIFQYLLEDLGERLSCQGCNDLPSEIADKYSEADWLEINTRYEAWNSEGRDEVYPQPLPDYCYLSIIMNKLGFAK